MVAVGLVVPHGVQGTKAPVKAHHMKTVCGDNGFCGRLTSRYLCVRPFIRVIAVDTQILPCLLVVDGCAVIRKAVAFHRAVHITLCGFFCFFQRLIVPFLIKAVFKVMIRHYLILWCHPVGIIINHFFRQPFRFLGERVIQLPHFDDLCIDAARPQMLFCAVACAKKVFAVCPQMTQKAIVRVVFQQRLFLFCEEFIFSDELRDTPLHLRPCQFGGFRASSADDKEIVALLAAVLAGEPCGGFFFAPVLLHIPHYGVLALDISVPCTECIVYIVLRERTQQIMEPRIGSLKSLSVQAAAELRHIRK